jgi:hypothetical protein
VNFENFLKSQIAALQPSRCMTTAPRNRIAGGFTAQAQAQPYC